MKWDKNIKKQVNNEIIIQLLQKNKYLSRSKIYKKVLQIREKKDGVKINYQVVCRDVSRLLKNEIIKVVSGGPRSQILSLNY